MTNKITDKQLQDLKASIKQSQSEAGWPSYLYVHTKTLSDLIAKVESLAADAERYRWLRDMAHPSIEYPRDAAWVTDHRGWLIEEKELDSIIDAAMAKEKV